MFAVCVNYALYCVLLPVIYRSSRQGVASVCSWHPTVLPCRQGLKLASKSAVVPCPVGIQKCYPVARVCSWHPKVLPCRQGLKLASKSATLSPVSPVGIQKCFPVDRVSSWLFLINPAMETRHCLRPKVSHACKDILPYNAPNKKC